MNYCGFDPGLALFLSETGWQPNDEPVTEPLALRIAALLALVFSGIGLVFVA